MNLYFNSEYSFYSDDNQLFNLIKSLTAQEKKHFSLYVKYRTDAEKKYLQLYKLMHRASRSDEAAWKSQLKLSSEVKYRKTKSYLYQTLMDALRNYRQLSPRMQIHDYLSNVEILFLRNLHELALHELAKAYKIAEEYEFVEELVTIHEWAYKLRLTGDEIEQAGQSETAMLHNGDLLSKLLFYKRLYRKVRLFFMQTGYPRTGAELQAYEAMLEECKKLEQSAAGQGLPVRIAGLNTAIQSLLYRLCGNDYEAERLMNTLLQLLAEHPKVTLSTPAYTLPVLGFHLDLLAEKKHRADFESLAHKVKNMHFLSLRNNLKIKMMVLLAELKFGMETGNDNLRHTAVELEKLLPHFHLSGGDLEPGFTLSYYHLLTGNPEKALSFLQLIRQHQMHKALKEKQVYLRMLELMIHYDLKNFDFLYDRSGNADKLLRRKNKMYTIERLLIKYLVRSSKIISEKQRSMVLKSLMQKLASDTELSVMESNFYKHFNFKKWLLARSRT